ncbi:MAG: trans-aconitate methyltransferase [Alphaproteobacteria bacterium HGW-Alphaproteobacteria-6]|nr:MAG: trans-aconitate methyltransferase [Alphaproteobacteria bacterium HGW-Alphaproteobacteria-6]
MRKPPADWNPAAYGRFRGLRLRPALDLLARVADLPAAGGMVDLGCGNGVVGAALKQRFPGRVLTGVDGSTAMLAEAGQAGSLAPGGTLAVQMPRQYGAPSHRFLRDFAADMFPDRFAATEGQPPVMTPVEYHRLLAPLGRADVWEIDYVQRLEPAASGHPVRLFTEATAMRPYLDAISASEAAEFIQRYEAALAAAYPVETDGAVLFPFRRLFFTLTRTE